MATPIAWSREDRSARKQLIFGIALVAAAILIDPIRGRAINLGALRIAVIVVGLLAVLLAVAARRPRLRRATVAFIALSSIAYGCLLCIELLLAVTAPPHATKLALAGLRGRTIEDPYVGFRLTPNSVGTHDDGLIRAEYRHNARGDRDADEPVAGATRRILLLGDSFTYGQALVREETIEARIETRSKGTIDAYNLGAPGYAAIHSLRRFEQSDWWRGDDVVYLFFNNDLHSSSRRWDYLRVHDGYAVTRRRADGTAFTDDEIETQLRDALAAEPDKLTAKLGAWIGLTRLRKTAAALADRELRLTGMPLSALDPTVFDEAVRDALAMRARAESLGARFHLVVLPAPHECGERSWSHASGSFIAKARAAGLEPVEDLLQQLGPEHYVAHDGHFSASGADKAAQVVLRIVEAN